MTINPADVEAARRILAEHEQKFAGVPMVQKKAVKTPADHPDWTTKPDNPDEDMALIESWASEIEWRVKFLHHKVTTSVTSIYNKMRAELNDKGAWTPLAHLIHDSLRFEELGRQIREEW